MLDENTIPTLDAVAEILQETKDEYQRKFEVLSAEFKAALEACHLEIAAIEKAKDGEDGKDRFIISAMPIADGEKVDKNIVVKHRGGIFTSDRKSNGTPSQDPGAYTCLVNGIADINFKSIDERTQSIQIEMSDGLVISHEVKFNAPIFKGTFSDEATYTEGDIIIKDKKTLINIGGDDWKMFVFPQKGDKGEPGKDGKDGQDYVDALAQAHLEAK
jgi:hypothetical protein